MRTELLAFVVCISLQTPGQSFQLLPVDVTTNRLSLRAIELVPGGDYICVGGYRQSFSDLEHGFMARVSPSLGSIVWARIFETGTVLWSVSKTANGEYVASGQVIGNHGFVIRFNPGGGVLWRTDLFGGTDLRCVAESSDGNIWAGGTIGKELLACFGSAGAFLWAKSPPTGVSSLTTHLIPNGAEMLVFGPETYIPNALDQQASVRRFDLSGNELSHTVVGNNSGAAEIFYDVARLSGGGYALALQYVYPVVPFAGRQEIGIIKLDAGLAYLPVETRAYIVPSRSLVSPRIATDPSGIYLFCTQNSGVDGGAIAAKLSLANGAVQTTKYIARGATRVNKIIWNGANLVLPSCQDLVAMVGNPPETLADVAVVNPATLERVDVMCDPPVPPPDIALTTYYGTVSATSVTPVVWLDVSVSEGFVSIPTPFALSYSDCNETLPIELTSFTARPENFGVILRWTTASERNNAYFEVERSTDLINFEPIARVAGAGNSFQTLDYEAFDSDPHMGTSYYRLRQVDGDGSESWSEVESVYISRLEDVLEYYDASGKSVQKIPQEAGLYLVRPAGSLLPLRKIVVLLN